MMTLNSSTCIGFSLKFQMKSTQQSAVDDTTLACKADSMPGMNSDVLLKNKTTEIYFDLLFV